MVLIPLSLPFEIIFPVFAIWFAEKGEFGRWIGICIWPLEMALLVLPLAFIADGPVIQTIAFPANILGLVVLMIFLFWIWSMVDLYYFRQGIKETGPYD